MKGWKKHARSESFTASACPQFKARMFKLPISAVWPFICLNPLSLLTPVAELYCLLYRLVSDLSIPQYYFLSSPGFSDKPCVLKQLHSFFLFKFISKILFIWKSYRETLLLHSPDGHNKKGWAWSLSPGTTSGSPTCAAGAHKRGPPSAVFLRLLSGSWTGSETAGTQTGHPCWMRALQVTALLATPQCWPHVSSLIYFILLNTNT